MTTAAATPTTPTVTASTATSSAPTPSSRRQATRWGPRNGAGELEQTTPDGPAVHPAVRRPLAPAAPVTGATRWGLRHRSIGAAAIARLITGLPTTPAPPTRQLPAPQPAAIAREGGQAPPQGRETASGATSTATPAAMDVDGGPPELEPWLLRFDGACRHNPGPGGAGAALFNPSGTVVWTCSHFMPSSTETNNTAEYTALLLGVQSATHHGARRLRIEGDSHLVIAQVRGSFSCSNARLRQLRNRVRVALRRLDTYKLTHIDRKANSHADRLANRALDQRRSSSECGPHGNSMAACLGVPTTAPADSVPAVRPTPAVAATACDSGVVDDEMTDIEAEIAARDGGECDP
uniref:RNase H type-1 domain-containing protein n=1 Tax=Phytophthora fragariae TaxID=53985 RepID=A0A6A3E4Q0_9STRA|nr:hypothetical protein PF009_g23084 [Phytophthora fragariae]